jgi:hypothetical protein
LLFNVPGLQGVNSSPPDTTGAIGPTRFVQLVNTRVGILNRKSNSFQVEEFLSPTPTIVDYYLPIKTPETADDLNQVLEQTRQVSQRMAEVIAGALAGVRRNAHPARDVAAL